MSRVDGADVGEPAQRATAHLLVCYGEVRCRSVLSGLTTRWHDAYGIRADYRISIPQFARQCRLRALGREVQILGAEMQDQIGNSI